MWTPLYPLHQKKQQKRSPTYRLNLTSRSDGDLDRCSACDQCRTAWTTRSSPPCQHTAFRADALHCISSACERKQRPSPRRIHVGVASRCESTGGRPGSRVAFGWTRAEDVLICDGRKRWDSGACDLRGGGESAWMGPGLPDRVYRAGREWRGWRRYGDV